MRSGCSPTGLFLGVPGELCSIAVREASNAPGGKTRPARTGHGKNARMGLYTYFLQGGIYVKEWLLGTSCIGAGLLVMRP
jgi:hypothetical protein